MKGIRRGTGAAFWVIVCIFGQLVGSGTALAVAKNGAVGDNCSIDLPSGLKEPGKDDGKGHCCSVFDEKKCVDLPKSNPASRGALAGGAAKTTAVLQAAPTPTPSKRVPASKVKSAAPIPSPAPQ
jgi:hypothetical protein